MKRVIYVLLAGTLLLGGAASAHVQERQDGEDLKGGLDIRKTVLDRDEISVHTFDRFTKSSLYSGNGFTLYADSRGGPKWDFRVTVGLYEDSYPYCNTYDRDGFSRGGGEAEKTPRSMTCPYGHRAFNATKQIRWRVESSGTRFPDNAPNTGWYKH